MSNKENKPRQDKKEEKKKENERVDEASEEFFSGERSTVVHTNPSPGNTET